MPKAIKQPFLFCLFLFISGYSVSAQVEQSKTNYVPGWINTDTIKAGKFDTGKMWTFEYPPINYFKEEYNFAPSKEWYDHVRLSALRFATYCSASFISVDGLIMTNDHCARESATDVTNEGEKINDDGFYAKNISEERKVPGLFVDQLILIKDVTDEVQKEIDKGTSYEDKIKREEDIIKIITDKEEKESGLSVHITPLYNGGRYSLYGYKRYNDVRLVFIPESQIGFFGGDDDNFTYPRFNLDCTFFRVYENDKHIETNNYFKWKNDGAKNGEPVFVVGNPGSSNRLNTIAQLEYERDYQYPHLLEYFRNMLTVYSHLMETKPERQDELNNEYLKYSNSEKAISGYLDGLRDPILMQKKRDFENKFRKDVNRDPDLKNKYGDLWDKIDSTRKKMAVITKETELYTINQLTSSDYFLIAQEILNIADELKYPEDQRSDDYKGTRLDSTIQDLIPNDFDKEKNRNLLISQIKQFYDKSGKENNYIKDLTGGKDPDSAAGDILSLSVLTDESKIRDLIKQGSDSIYKSTDPFIRFISKTEGRQSELQSESNEIETREKGYNRSLGRALYDVYGTSIPPDATFTLRISDGVIRGFNYNGTLAPPFTTYYGMYDRYYSFNKKFPWNLPERWKTPPADFDLSVPFNFSATNDIIGGNSGSPIINEKGEIVGLAFDGNIQSLPGDFIYDPTDNRTIAVHPKGITEALKKIYKADRLANEIEEGKLPK
jgi:hypothetical protein